jgi:hypothetical protein
MVRWDWFLLGFVMGAYIVIAQGFRVAGHKHHHTTGKPNRWLVDIGSALWILLLVLILCGWVWCHLKPRHGED